jgi:translation elongation factor EF-Tu-like GTPase
MNRRHIRADFHLLPADAGGRSTPLLAGYRSLLRFADTQVDYGFELSSLDVASLEGVPPGSSATATFSLWAAESLPMVVKGQRFEIREGNNVVGLGEVLEPSTEVTPAVIEQRRNR